MRNLAEINRGTSLAFDQFTTPTRYDSGVTIDRANPLTAVLLAEMRTTGGQLPWSRVMEQALHHPEYGYYTRHVAIGEKRDFITWPEKSIVFGQTIGNTAKTVWDTMGKPDQFDMVELGPGSGALAHSQLIWAERYHPDFFEALTYTLVEQSPKLTRQQAQNLSRFAENGKIQWIQGSALNLPLTDITGVIVSNELVDTIPAERVTRIGGDMVQMYIGVNNNQWTVIWDNPSAEVLDFIDTYDISIRERCEEPIQPLASLLQRRLDEALTQGAILTIDYGKDKEVGRRLMPAVRPYTNAFDITVGLGNDELLDLGKFDLTTDVNFRPMRMTAEADGLTVVFFGPQDAFLRRCGVVQLTDQLQTTEALQLQYARSLTERSFGFHAMMATKGISLSLSLLIHSFQFLTNFILETLHPASTIVHRFLTIS